MGAIINPYKVQPSNYVTLYTETFDDAAVSGTPGAPQYKYPAGWTDPAGEPAEPLTAEFQVYDDGGVAYQYSDVDIPAASGLRNLVFSNGGSNTESVTTKPTSTVGRSNIIIEFLMYRQPGCPAFTIEWSDDNSTWNNLAYAPPSADFVWHAVGPVSLPVGANNKANIYFKFTVVGDGTGAFVAIDDFVVKGI